MSVNFVFFFLFFCFAFFFNFLIHCSKNEKMKYFKMKNSGTFNFLHTLKFKFYSIRSPFGLDI